MKRVLGSLICMSAGWIASGSLGWILYWKGLSNDGAWIPASMLLGMGPAWLFIFLPAYALVPRDSWIKELYLAVPAGAICGLGLLLFCVGPNIKNLAWILPCAVALAGAVTAGAAALTLDWSRSGWGEEVSSERSSWASAEPSSST